MLFAATEGAVIFARTEKSMRAVDLVEQQMLTLAKSQPLGTGQSCGGPVNAAVESTSWRARPRRPWPR